MVGSASTFHYLGSPQRYNGIFSLSKTACITCCTRCCYTNNLFCPATSQLKWPRFHLWILDYSSLYSIAHKSKAPKCTMYTWAVMQMWSHTPAPRRTQIQMDTHPCECSRMQKTPTHTRVWCPSFYSLSLFLRLSRGSRCGHMTHCCCCCCCFMHVEMHLCHTWIVYTVCTWAVSVCLFCMYCQRFPGYHSFLLGIVLFYHRSVWSNIGIIMR